MPISARKSQQRIYTGGLKKSGILNDGRSVNCKSMRVCWDLELEQGVKRQDKIEPLRRESSIFILHTQ